MWKRFVEDTVRRVHQVKGSSIVRALEVERDTPKKKKKRKKKNAIGETIKKDLDLNGLFTNMVYDWIVQHHLIHVTDST